MPVCACLGSLCGGTLGVCIKPFLDSFIKHATYPFKASRNITKLDRAIGTLAAERNDFLNQIETDKHQKGWVETDVAKNWLQRVEKSESDSKGVRERYENRCRIFGCCFPNCWSNYKIGKQAAKILTDVNECNRDKPKNVTTEPPPPTVVHTPVYSVPLHSRVTQLQEGIHCVKNDPAGVIGIWGPGGVGKTHLLKEINNSLNDNTFFDHVSFVTASKGCSKEKIQAEIVKKHSLRKDDDVESQARIIFKFLEKKSFLILLDDIWDRIDLQKVGIPYPLGSADSIRRKVVLTTRLKEVCGKMEVRKYIDVACLPDDEAWSLFQDKVGQATLCSSPRIQSLAKDLVNELKGLPLALITIGWAMHPKTDPLEWELAIEYMKNSCCDKDDPLSMESVFRRLKFGYDSLKNETLRQCFLTCSLWPEDREITMDELVQCWMGLGLVGKCDIHSSYRKIRGLICDLKASCLLESGEYDASINGAFYRSSHAYVKMHDVVCDMAIWNSSGCGENNGKWVVRAGDGANSFRNTIPGKAECVSLMWSNITELPPFSPNDCPTKLRTLYLQGNRLDDRSIGAIQNFIELTYLDLSFNGLSNIPEEICALVNLEFLNLSNNEDITEVPVRLAELTKLKFLFLRETHVRNMPAVVISNFKKLQVLDLITHGTNLPSNTTAIIEVLCTLTDLKAVDLAVGSDVEYETLCKEAQFPIRDLTMENSVNLPVFCLSVDAPFDFADDPVPEEQEQQQFAEEDGAMNDQSLAEFPEDLPYF